MTDLQLLIRPFCEDAEWDRFVSKFVVGDCWEWTGALSEGYGVFRLSRTERGVAAPLVRAHQYAYVRLIGPVPDGLHLDHLCRNRPCVNPDHLEPVTTAENLRRSPLRDIGIHAAHAAVRARTHCPQGHPYDGVNTGRRPGTGHRYCRACARERMRANYQRKAA